MVVRELRGGEGVGGSLRSRFGAWMCSCQNVRLARCLWLIAMVVGRVVVDEEEERNAEGGKRGVAAKGGEHLIRVCNNRQHGCGASMRETRSYHTCFFQVGCLLPRSV